MNFTSLEIFLSDNKGCGLLMNSNYTWNQEAHKEFTRIKYGF